MKRKAAWLLVGVLLMLPGFACSKKEQAAESPDPPSSDHVTRTALVPPQVLVHKTFPVRGYAQFDFVVPAHIHNPRLRGSFKSFMKAGGGASIGGQAADMNILLLDEQGFNDFLHGETGTPTDAAGPSNSQQVEWGLTSTFDQPSKYYLVFVNPADGHQTRLVQADFTVSFE